jgi:hypothetical protein
MEITLKFDRVIILDEYFKWKELTEKEAVIGMINGKVAITQILTEDQYEEIKNQVKDKSKKKVKY